MMTFRMLILSLFLLQAKDTTTGFNDQDPDWIQLRNGHNAPFAVIRDSNSKLVAAIPHRTEGGVFVMYHVVDLDRSKDFIVACPDRQNGNVLYPQDWYDGEKTIYRQCCEHDLIPSVWKSQGGSRHAAGYWVWNGSTKRAEFVTLYEAVVEKENTIYTTYETQSENFISFFESNSFKIKEFADNHYHLVPYQDMPIYTWQISTTLFGFNIVSLSKNAIYYLRHVDYYIKNAIIEARIKTKIYSGETTTGKGCRIIFRIVRCHHQNVGVAFITLIENPSTCSFTCHKIPHNYGWSFTYKIKENKDTSSRDRRPPEFVTYICQADGDLYFTLKLKELEPMGIPKGTRFNGQ